MKQIEKQGKKNKIGAVGEIIAANYLRKTGFTIVEQNYLKKWGEIDIIAEKSGKIHFVEVKTVSYGTKEQLSRAVSYGTWRPEENVHKKKIYRMNRTIETWLSEKSATSEWQIDVVSVRIVSCEKYATVKYIPNVIF